MEKRWWWNEAENGWKRKQASYAIFQRSFIDDEMKINQRNLETKEAGREYASMEPGY